MRDQSVKADAGKLPLTIVPTDAIRSMAKLEVYEKESCERKVPRLIRKTRSVKGSWKGLFECPYCQKVFEANISNVMQGRQHSCGCMKGEFMCESRGLVGDSKSRLYRIWAHILERCNKPSCKEYKYYGARGIKCEFESFAEFRDFALSHGYQDHLTVERINVNGNYAPDNVAFVPKFMQNRNTRKNVMITYKGLTLCASEWASILGIRPDTLTKRKRSGWDDTRIIETKVGDSLDISLVPVAVIEAIREVRVFGVQKYKDPDNWQKVEIERYRDALFRHLLAYLDDPDGVDPESGIANYKHLACNAAFICHMEAVRRGEIRCEEETTLYSSDE